MHATITQRAREQAALARDVQRLQRAVELLQAEIKPSGVLDFQPQAAADVGTLQRLVDERIARLDPGCRQVLQAWSEIVSMTINGPAPTVLAFYFVTAVRQQKARFEAENGRLPSDEEYHALKMATYRLLGVHIRLPHSSSRRPAMAIQLVINREWGLACSENANQGCFIVDELTDLVEEAVLKEFDRLSELTCSATRTVMSGLKSSSPVRHMRKRMVRFGG